MVILIFKCVIFDLKLSFFYGCLDGCLLLWRLKLIKITKKVSASIFALILICFFLPFVSISCQNLSILRLSGIELVTGTTMQTPDLGSQSEQEKIPPDTRAIFALTAAAVGLGTSFSQKRRSALFSAVSAVIGFSSLLWLKSTIDTEIAEQGSEFIGIKVTYESGFWSAFLLFISASILNTWIFFEKSIKSLQED